MIMIIRADVDRGAVGICTTHALSIVRADFDICNCRTRVVVNLQWMGVDRLNMDLVAKTHLILLF